MIFALAILLCGAVDLPDEDLAAYASALKPNAVSAAVEARFLDLWERPDAFRGRSVRVEGRVARQFFAPASGDLPARTELWLEVENHNLICAVFPGTANAATKAGARVAFEGVSLGKLDYESGDVRRVAPLIVGPNRPRLLEARAARSSLFSSFDWILGLACLGIVASILVRAMAKRPRPIRPETNSVVEFES